MGSRVQRINPLLDRAKRYGYVTQAYRHLKYCARLQMNYLVKLFPTLTMFCTLCCRRYLQHRNITILDVGRTHIHFLDRTVICVTATS